MTECAEELEGCPHSKILKNFVSERECQLRKLILCSEFNWKYNYHLCPIYRKKHLNIKER